MKINVKKLLAGLCLAAAFVAAPVIVSQTAVTVSAAAGTSYTVKGLSTGGYLALRSGMYYSDANVIGQLYNGNTVQVQSFDSNPYWYVYAPSLGKYGYVNFNYLTGNATPISTNPMTVSLSSGYLALRNAKVYDDKNEMAALYNGDTVYVSDWSDSTYWYVYSPTVGYYGYVNKNYLTGTKPGEGMMTVSVAKGYLALRNAMAYDDKNVIGELYTGDQVQVVDKTSDTYWYVYAPSLKKYGYVNRNYLTSKDTVSGFTMTVSVSDGYLALRNAMTFDTSNEIGAIYNGEQVKVQDTTNDTYWYVYAPSLGKYGYVNRNYLTGTVPSSSVSGTEMTVSVATGYLALRSAAATDTSNEIGALYSGEKVKVQNKNNAQFWYVYAPSLGKYGYVNKDYLLGSNAPSSGFTRTVSVAKGFLALRSFPEYDTANEIGELYTNDKVTVVDTSNSQYWYVYSPKYDLYGYVNKDYLY